MRLVIAILRIIRPRHHVKVSISSVYIRRIPKSKRLAISNLAGSLSLIISVYYILKSRRSLVLVERSINIRIPLAGIWTITPRDDHNMIMRLVTVIRLAVIRRLLAHRKIMHM